MVEEQGGVPAVSWRPSRPPITKVYLARQPILDSQGKVFGYELLHRSSSENRFEHPDPERASIELIDNCLNLFPFDSVTGGKKVFVNATSALLSGNVLSILPRDKTVLEVLEDVEPTPEVLASVRALKTAGYRIALDDFTADARLDPLVELADFIKIDWRATVGAARQECFERYARPGRVMVAEKIETHAELKEAQRIGFVLFQGYFFCEPEVLERKDLPRFKLHYLRFLSALGQRDLDLERIEEIIRQEASLSVRLLHYLNSATFGIRRRMISIRQALVHLGERPLRRWGALIAVGGLGEDKPSELVVTTMIRARFCELLGQKHLAGESSRFFLTGLFSTLDAMLDLPLEEGLDHLAIAPEIKDAILGNDSHMGRALSLIRAMEIGDWQAVGALEADLGVSGELLSARYCEAVRWAESIFDEQGRNAA